MEKYAQLDDLITHILTHDEIAEQSDLQAKLQAHGLEVPQATLSRRLKKLSVAKVGGVYKILDYDRPHVPLVLNIQVSDFGHVVLQTHPGNAHGLAYYLDRKYVSFSPQNNEEKPLMGTIAGDDTVLLIVKNQAQLARLIKALAEDFPYLPLAQDKSKD